MHCSGAILSSRPAQRSASRRHWKKFRQVRQNVAKPQFLQNLARRFGSLPGGASELRGDP